MTYEHEDLFFSCALSLSRGYRGNASFFLASEMPESRRKAAAEKLGKERMVLPELADMDVHAMKAAMEDGRNANFDDAFIDMWLLGRFTPLFEYSCMYPGGRNATSRFDGASLLADFRGV